MSGQKVKNMGDDDQVSARRRHQDVVSKKMGDLLLKGYKMLGTSCEDCSVSGKPRFSRRFLDLSMFLSSVS
jgi:uncharacterized Zn finger protein (UPF0148 family)